MLIKITRSCHNGCIHCCNDNKPCDEHMSLSTFEDVLKFCLKYDNPILGHTIAGGEPTEHPQFLDFIDTFYKYYQKDYILTIATNGHYLISNQSIINEYLDKYPALFFQVTYDDRYYIKKLDITKRILRHERIAGVCKVDHIYPKGRAVINKIPASDKIMCPPCVNLRLLLTQIPNCDLKNLLSSMRKFNKLCTPSIQYDGYIAFGEYDGCPKWVSIYDSEDKILSAIIKNDFSCCPEAAKIFNQKTINGTLKFGGF